ncbi:MAG TPA: hypothetical protein EYH05_12895 [Anaerolineae bacterium]|nr:hypothetical protein [Anaerolineae bacterium]
MAQKLVVSPNTVETHLWNLYRKLRVNSRAQDAEPDARRLETGGLISNPQSLIFSFSAKRPLLGNDR